MALLFLTLISCLHSVLGHGGMYYPWTWHSSTQPKPTEGVSEFKFDLMVPIPKEHCEGQGRRFHLGLTEWFTNRTYRNAPKPTIPERLFDKWILEKLRERKGPDADNYHPWTAPGTAKIFDSCGVNGGNPKGCGLGNVYGNCCGSNCGGYEGGKSAIEHAADGLFDNAPVIEWKRGSTPLVYWKMGAEHRGGYAYRLCKVPKEGVAG